MAALKDLKAVYYHADGQGRVDDDVAAAWR